jgi:hypothetical protein
LGHEFFLYYLSKTHNTICYSSIVVGVSSFLYTVVVKWKQEVLKDGVFQYQHKVGVELTHQYYHPVHSSRGVTWDDDLIEHLMIIFEETYIRINQGNLSAMHWNQVSRDFVTATGA